MSTKPSAIIFGSSFPNISSQFPFCVWATDGMLYIPNAYIGGLNTCSRTLAALLVPLDGEPLVSVSQAHVISYAQ